MTSRIRHLRPADYPLVISVIDTWWGGRPMAGMLPRLFFEHFTDTSFAAEHDGRLAGFLAGFISQSRPGEAYIHFVGVDPAQRGGGLGRLLYEAFFRAAQARGCILVRAVTSPANHGSVAFHQRMGFQLEPGQAACQSPWARNSILALTVHTGSRVHAWPDHASTLAVCRSPGKARNCRALGCGVGSAGTARRCRRPVRNAWARVLLPGMAAVIGG